MKHIDEIYKDWAGHSHIEDSCHPVHDSAAVQDFAEYYHNEMMGGGGKSGSCVDSSDVGNGGDGGTKNGDGVLPCPFCGRYPLVRIYSHTPPGSEDKITSCFVSCGHCDFGLEDREEAVEQWNTRGGVSF